MKDEALRLAQEALNSCEIDGDGWSGPNYWFDSDKVGRANRAIKQALEQPEPVIDKSAAIRIATSLGWTPKREWQGLTDVDVSKILDEQNGFYTFEKCFNFAKAVEAKLKEKNNG